MAKKVGPTHMRFEGAEPMRFGPAGSVVSGEQPSKEERKLISAASKTVHAYRSTANKLLGSTFSHLKQFAPPHLANPGNTLVACCSEGVVVRYETESERPSKLVGAWMPEPLAAIAATLSQNLVWFRKTVADPPAPDSFGIELSLFVTSQDTQERRTIAENRISFDVALSGIPPPYDAVGRPPRVASIKNSLMLQIGGRLEAENGDDGKPFVLESRMRLPVGWECIELFPAADSKSWRPNAAAAWAEADILAAVVAHQMREAKLNSLDPSSEARRRFASQFEEFEQLLHADPPEEELQSYLLNHPQLLCPAYTRMWAKLPLGATVTDFVFQEATGDYLLVELEKSAHRLFNKKGHSSGQLNHAHGQVLDWLRYIGDNKGTVERELGLHAISTHPRALIVIGRSTTMTAENRAKLAVMANSVPRLEIMAYDDVLARAKQIVDNLLGPYWAVPSHTRVFYPSVPKAAMHTG